MPYILTCSQTQLNKPCQFRYFMCSSSSTPGATNKALDLLHQVCLKQHLFSRFVQLGGILFNFGETNWNICCVELFQLLLIDLFIANS